MLAEEDMSVFTKATAESVRTSRCSDPVLVALRKIVSEHDDKEGTEMSDACLIRWYLSRKENFEKTKRAIGKFLKWRKAEKVNDMTVDEVQKMEDTKVCVIGGPCTKGRPCAFIYAGRHDKDAQSDADVKRFLVYKIEQVLLAGDKMREELAEAQAAQALEKTLEKTTDETSKDASAGSSSPAAEAQSQPLDGETLLLAAANASATAAAATTINSVPSRYRNVDTFTLVFDLSGFGFKSMNYDAIACLINLLTYQYPHAIERVVILNTPWIFNTCWTWIKGLIPSTAVELVNFANTVDEVSELVSPESLPSDISFE